MGKQYDKVEKRARRRKYLIRVKERRKVESRKQRQWSPPAFR